MHVSKVGHVTEIAQWGVICPNFAPKITFTPLEPILTLGFFLKLDIICTVTFTLKLAYFQSGTYHRFRAKGVFIFEFRPPK